MTDLSYYRAKMGKTPSKQLARKLERVKMRYGMEPEDYVRLLVKHKFACTRIAAVLGIHYDSLRIFMIRHNIEPCKSPEYCNAPDHQDNLKLLGRRASPKNLVVIDGRPFVVLMAERGHVPASAVYVRTRRRLSWGWSFEDAYADAVANKRNGGTKSREPRSTS